MKHLVLLILLFSVSLLQAEEKIKNYNVDIVVNTDKSITVTEEITVIAEGYQIQRGIFREIPTVFLDDNGRRYKVNLDVLEVLKDGSSENYSVEGTSDGKSIRIGNADIILEPGTYTYTIKYKMADQVRFFDGYDEVYWNAIGPQWDFIIEKASATLHLPEGAEILQNSGYSGYEGKETCDCTVTQIDESTITYTLTKQLNPREGLTLGVGFTKGVITPPTEAELRKRELLTYLPLIIFILGLILVFVYYMYAWTKVGKDPGKGAIIPRFEPPDNLTPSAVRYIYRMGFDNKSFAAAVVSMAVKGAITIDKTGKKYILKRSDAGFHMLSLGEKKIAAKLFSSGENSIELKQSNHAILSSAISALQKQMEKDFKNENFKKNSGWIVPGILLSIATLILGTVYLFDDQDAFASVIVMIFVSIFFIPIFIGMFKGLIRAEGWRKLPHLIGPLLIIGVPIYFINMFVSLDMLPLELVIHVFPYLFIILLLIGLNFLFTYLMQAPTISGRKRMDEIEGLKMYMEVAEKNRLNILNPPEMTPQLFEKLLPYAVALNIENKWGNQFERVIAKAIENNEYHPTWYAGRGLTNVSYLSSDLGSSFSSSISSASTSPQSSSSSGSGGGGSSGGGGGGGGGGGW